MLKKKKLYFDETPVAEASSSSSSSESDEDGDLKGWRESGYKIVTEVEFVDKGELEFFFFSRGPLSFFQECFSMV